MVIGRGGETLRRIERETGARVQFAAGEPPPVESGANLVSESSTKPGIRTANISGTVSQVTAARNAIKALIENNPKTGAGTRRDASSASGGPPPRGRDVLTTNSGNKLTFSVPDKCVGLIIGRGGESINEIQRRSGARVNIVPESQSVNGRRPVNLFGADEANEKARELIEAIVRQDELGTKKGRVNSPESTHVSSIVWASEMLLY
jgi:far upstream element-binding protein